MTTKKISSNSGNTNSSPETVKVKRKPSKRKYVVKFDKSGFYLAMGLGVVMIAIGALVVWATLTAPEGGSTSSLSSNSRRIVSLLPDSMIHWIALIMGVLFVLFGILCVLLGIKLVVTYFIEKAKE